jgi:hypothetical protein
MELVLTAQEIEPAPIKETELINLENNGILNTNFKRISRNNFKNFNPGSVFGKRQLVKHRQFQLTSNIETVLKVSLFAIIMILTLS